MDFKRENLMNNTKLSALPPKTIKIARARGKREVKWRSITRKAMGVLQKRETDSSSPE